MTDQLATRAVDALAAIRAIEPGSEHPMRATVRTLKREAEFILEQAFNRAHALAYAAQDVIKDYDQAEKERGAA